MRRYPLFFLIVQLLLANGATALTGHVNPAGTPAPEAETYTNQVRLQLTQEQKRGKGPASALYNGYEKIIRNNAQRNGAGFKSRTLDQTIYMNYSFAHGQDLLEQLSYHPGPCISKTTVVSHGWGDSAKSGGEGIPIYSPTQEGEEEAFTWPALGIYLNEEARLAQVQKSIDSYAAKGVPLSDAQKKRIQDRSAYYGATLDQLEAKIKSGEIKFCSQEKQACTLQLYACNLSDAFAYRMMEVTQCQIVYGTGNVTGIDTKSGQYDDFWIGDPKTGNTRNGRIVRITPYTENGKVVRGADGRIKFHADEMTGKGMVYDSVNMVSVPNPLKK